MEIQLTHKKQIWVLESYDGRRSIRLRGEVSKCL